MLRENPRSNLASRGLGRRSHRADREPSLGPKILRIFGPTPLHRRSMTCEIYRGAELGPRRRSGARPSLEAHLGCTVILRHDVIMLGPMRSLTLVLGPLLVHPQGS